MSDRIVTNYTEGAFLVPSTWPAAAKKDFVLLCIYNGAKYEGANKYFTGSPEDLEITTPPDGGWENTSVSSEPIAVLRKLYPLYFGHPEFFPTLKGTVWDNEAGACGFCDEIDFDYEYLKNILEYIVCKYKIRRADAAKISYAYTCSHPIPDSFGGKTIEIYDESTQPFEKGRGAVETGVSWIGNPNTILTKVLWRVKCGLPIQTDVSELKELEGHIYPELTWTLTKEQNLIIEDTQWFSPRLMDMVIKHAQIEWAKQSGLWLPTPDMVWWGSGKGVRFCQHEHASAAECRKAKELYKHGQH